MYSIPPFASTDLYILCCYCCYYYCYYPSYYYYSHWYSLSILSRIWFWFPSILELSSPIVPTEYVLIGCSGWLPLSVVCILSGWTSVPIVVCCSLGSIYLAPPLLVCIAIGYSLAISCKIPIDWPWIPYPSSISRRRRRRRRMIYYIMYIYFMDRLIDWLVDWIYEVARLIGSNRTTLFIHSSIHLIRYIPSAVVVFFQQFNLYQTILVAFGGHFVIPLWLK